MQPEVPVRAALRLAYLPGAGRCAQHVELHHVVWFPFSGPPAILYPQLDGVAVGVIPRCPH